MGKGQSKEMSEENVDYIEHHGTGSVDSNMDDDEEEFIDTEDYLEFTEDEDEDEMDGESQFPTPPTIPSSSSVSFHETFAPASLCVNYNADGWSCSGSHQGHQGSPRNSIADLGDFELEVCKSSRHSSGSDISLETGKSTLGQHSDLEGGSIEEGSSGSPEMSASESPGERLDSKEETTPADQEKSVTDVSDLRSPPRSPVGEEGQSSCSGGSNSQTGRPGRNAGQELPNHVRMTDGEFGLIFQCICGKAFSSRENVNYHKNCDGSEKEFQCPECPKTFTLRSHYNVHLKHVHREPLLSCTFCNKRFHRKVRLSAHLKVHTGVRPFECPDCDLAFTSKEYLRNHCRQVHYAEGRPVKCDLCDMAFTTKKSLLSHAKTHQDSSYPCGSCLRVFKYSHSLQHHVAQCHPPTVVEPLTQVERPFFKFQCSIKECGKVFASKARLDTHESEHAAVGGALKPFRCKSCPSAYIRKDNLLRHMTRAHPTPNAPQKSSPK